MKINVVNTSEAVEIELTAENQEDKENIAEFLHSPVLKNPSIGRLISFPREEEVSSVKIRLE